MFAKSLIWCIMYPIAFFGYFIMAVLEAIWFLFNSPVDIWMIISRAVDGQEEKEEQSQ